MDGVAFWLVFAAVLLGLLEGLEGLVEGEVELLGEVFGFLVEVEAGVEAYFLVG